MARIAKIVLAGVFVTSLVGCSSGGSSEKLDKKGSAAVTTTVAGGSGGTGESTGSPPSTGQIDRAPAPKGTGIIGTTKMTSCDTEPGPVTASGTVQLPAGMAPGTAAVTLTWRNAQTATVIARTRVEVENVSADAAVDWEAKNLLPENEIAVDCVLGAIVRD